MQNFSYQTFGFHKNQKKLETQKNKQWTSSNQKFFLNQNFKKGRRKTDGEESEAFIVYECLVKIFRISNAFLFTQSAM